MSILRGANAVKNTKLHAIRVTNSTYGLAIPIVFGQNRVQACLLWYANFQSHVNKQTGGKGIGNSGQSYNYTASILAALCQGPITGITNIWDSTGRLGASGATESFTVPGSGLVGVSQQAYFQIDLGVGVATSYSATHTDYGAPFPTALSGVMLTGLVQVPSSPGPGQYSVSGGVYTFNPAQIGATVSISYVYSAEWLQATEIHIIPASSPWQETVENTSYFHGDVSVVFYPSGTPLIRGGSGAGHYSASSGGVYTFDSADANKTILITYQYQDQSSLQLPTTQVNLTLIEGSQGQAPWGYLTSAFPSNALGYTELAMVASPSLNLGGAGELPNYNYEVIGLYPWGAGITDASPAACIEGLLTDPGFGAGFPATHLDDWGSNPSSAFSFWAANSFFISPVIQNQETAASIIGNWLDAGQVGAFFSEGLLKLVPYGDTSAAGNGHIFNPNTQPVVDLNDDDFVSQGDNENPVQVSQTDPRDLYNSVKVEYAPRLNNYNTDSVPEQDDAMIAQYGLRPEGSQSFDFITTLAAAQFTANLRLRRNLYVDTTYRFKLGWFYSYLEPMDIVTITDLGAGLNKTPVRITQIDDDGQSLDIVAEAFPWGTASPTLYPKEGPGQGYTPSVADPGNTSALIFEGTNRANQQKGNVLYIAASGTSDDWGGCEVYVSTDGGSTYAQQATIDQKATTGLLQSAMQPANITPTSNNGTNGDLVVSIDQPSPNSYLVPNTTTTVSGWAITGASNTLSSVKIAVGVGGWVNPSAVLGDLRNDIANVFPGQTGSPNLGWHYVLNTSGFPAGVYITLAAIATDSAGNVATATMSFVVAGPETLTVLLDSSSMEINPSGDTQSNLAAIVTAAGQVEIVAFPSAGVGLIGPGYYQLNGIERAQLQSPQIAHVVGEGFTLLNNAVLMYTFDPKYIGSTIYFKFLSFNAAQTRQQDLSAVSAVPFTVEGSAAGAIAVETGIFLSGLGSVAPSYAPGISYGATSTSITISWNVTIFRTNSSRATVTLIGNQTVTGLTAPNTYNFYPYNDDTVPGGSFQMVTDGGLGTPAWAHVGNLLQWQAEQALNTHTPLSDGPIGIACVSSGSGGGAGGGTGSGSGANAPYGSIFFTFTSATVVSVNWSAANTASDVLAIYAQDVSSGASPVLLGTAASGTASFTRATSHNSMRFWIQDVTVNSTIAEKLYIPSPLKGGGPTS